MIPASRRRLVVLYAVVAALLISLGGRLWYLQVLTGKDYAQLAALDQTQSVITPSVRGQILDDGGQPLVDNASSLVVTVNIMDLATQSDGGSAVLARLATLLHMSGQAAAREAPAVQRQRSASRAGRARPTSRFRWRSTCRTRWPWRSCRTTTSSPGSAPGWTRWPRYPAPDGANPAQVLGYLGPITPQQMKQQHLPSTGFAGEDLVGQAGLELQYNKYLEGTPGREVLSVNSAGQQLGTVRTVDPQTGDDLVTSINAQLQGDLQTILANTLTHAQQTGSPHATTAAGVVMTTTGRVVAMASLPSYDPSVWTGGISEAQYRQLFGTGHGEPILNRVTQGEYAPGSTFKVISTAAAVHAGYSLASTYNCPATSNIARPLVRQRRAAADRPDQPARSAGDLLRHGVLRAGLPDLPARPPEGQRGQQPEGADPGNAEDGGGLGVRQRARHRPAGAEHRHHPDPGMALLPVEGQRAYRPELVQVRQGERLVRAADRIPGLPLRQRVGAR